MGEQELFKKGRTLALKIMIESYLMAKDEAKAKEVYANKKVTDDLTISGEETQLLHLYLVDEFKAVGLDLNELIKVSEPNYDGKRLAKVEIDELIRRADMLLIQISVLKEYIDAK